MNTAFGFPQQQQSCQINSPGPVVDVVSEEHALVQSLSASNRTGSSRFAAQGSSRKTPGKNPGKYSFHLGAWANLQQENPKGKLLPQEFTRNGWWF